MIHLMEDFEPWDIFSARVWAAWRSYSDAQFWVQDHASAAISLVDGFAILAVKEDADWEELLAFLQMQPWARLQCAAGIAGWLPFDVEWTSLVMRLVEPKQVPAEACRPAVDPGEVYDILTRCGLGAMNRNDWMADMALRWRKGTAQSWMIGGQSTASAMALAEGYCFIGAVGTLPEARGQGLAGQLVTDIACLQRAQGREVWLSCKEGLAGFYESVGFARAGEMATLRKEAA